MALLPNRYRYWAYGCHFVDCADAKQVDYWVEVKQLSTPEAVLLGDLSHRSIAGGAAVTDLPQS